MTKQYLAYAAGFFDGEGYVGASMSGKYLRIEVSVSQKDAAVLLWYKKTFGGGVYGSMSRHGTVYQWKTHGEAAIMFLSTMMPYLIVKRDEAQGAIDIWNGRHDQERTRERVRIYKEVRNARKIRLQSTEE